MAASHAAFPRRRRGNRIGYDLVRRRRPRCSIGSRGRSPAPRYPLMGILAALNRQMTRLSRTKATPQEKFPSNFDRSAIPRPAAIRMIWRDRDCLAQFRGAGACAIAGSRWASSLVAPAAIGNDLAVMAPAALLDRSRSLAAGIPRP